MISPARSFCTKHRLIALDGTVRLTEVLDTLATVFPGSLEKQNIARKILSDTGLDVVELADDNS